MPRATTKDGLLKAASEQFEKLLKLIDSIPKDEQTASFDFDEAFLQKQKEAHWTRDENLRDVLVHLYEWHRLLLNWVNANMGGQAKPFLPEPYNWKTYGQMNVEFWEKHQSTSYEDSMKMLLESHSQVMSMIEAFSDTELFEKKHFSWTGTTTLGAYCVSATSSHYDWAMKKIKKHIESYSKKN